MSGARSIAAFFDLDGTLLPAPSLELRFLQYLFRRRLLRTSNVLKWVARSIRPGQLRKLAANKTYLAGLPESVAASWADAMLSPEPSCGRLRFFEDGMARLAWHQSQNHRVFLISGTLSPLAAQLLHRWPGEIGLVATELATTSSPSLWTGELAGEHLVGFAKLRAMIALAAAYPIDLRDSYAYGDSLSDCAMLEAVGHPHAVNPSRPLARIARARRWKISNWKFAQGPSTAGQPKHIPITRRAGTTVIEER